MPGLQIFQAGMPTLLAAKGGSVPAADRSIFHRILLYGRMLRQSIDVAQDMLYAPAELAVQWKLFEAEFRKQMA